MQSDNINSLHVNINTNLSLPSFLKVQKCHSPSVICLLYIDPVNPKYPSHEQMGLFREKEVTPNCRTRDTCSWSNSIYTINIAVLPLNKLGPFLYASYDRFAKQVVSLSVNVEIQ